MNNVVSINTGKPISNTETAPLREFSSDDFWHHSCPGIGLVTMVKACACQRCGASHYTQPGSVNPPRSVDQGVSAPCFNNPSTPDDAA